MARTRSINVVEYMTLKSPLSTVVRKLDSRKWPE